MSLVSKKKKIAIEFFQPGQGIQEQVFFAKQIPLRRISPSVKPKPQFQQYITNEIQKNGLLWPLIVMRNDKNLFETPEFQCVHSSMLLEYNSRADFVVIIGNNRYYAAVSASTDSISCVEIPAIKWLRPVELAIGAEQQPL